VITLEPPAVAPAPSNPRRRLALPVIDPPSASPSPAEIASLQAEIRDLARARNAVILAHNYQRPEVQDVADFVGDSLGLSRAGARTEAEVIAFAGVHFMAETAAILSPEKTILIPDLRAGCSLADSITADQLRRWKADHPGAVVVSYVNTTAEVKAESDYCCTSGNARAVIESIPADREILFLPDVNLGIWLERVTGRKLRIWLGECHVHAGIRSEDIERWQTESPDAELLVHPECGCASQCMAFGNDNVRILSTEDMIRFARSSEKERFLVATEVGILHRLAKEAPEKRFEPVSEAAVCAYMKTITLQNLRDSLREMRYEVTVPADIAARARGAIERMVAIG
jgi:quinolinate synthase